jgi:hypothetical protein
MTFSGNTIRYSSDYGEFKGPMDNWINNKADGFTLDQVHKSPSRFVGVGGTSPDMTWTNDVTLGGSLYGEGVSIGEYSNLYDTLTQYQDIDNPSNFEGVGDVPDGGGGNFTVGKPTTGTQRYTISNLDHPGPVDFMTGNNSYYSIVNPGVSPSGIPGFSNFFNKGGYTFGLDDKGNSKFLTRPPKVLKTGIIGTGTHTYTNLINDKIISFTDQISNPMTANSDSKYPTVPAKGDVNEGIWNTNELITAANLDSSIVPNSDMSVTSYYDSTHSANTGLIGPYEGGLGLGGFFTSGDNSYFTAVDPPIPGFVRGFGTGTVTLHAPQYTSNDSLLFEGESISDGSPSGYSFGPGDIGNSRYLRKKITDNSIEFNSGQTLTGIELGTGTHEIKIPPSGTPEIGVNVTQTFRTPVDFMGTSNSYFDNLKDKISGFNEYFGVGALTEDGDSKGGGIGTEVDLEVPPGYNFPAGDSGNSKYLKLSDTTEGIEDMTDAEKKTAIAGASEQNAMDVVATGTHTIRKTSDVLEKESCQMTGSSANYTFTDQLDAYRKYIDSGINSSYIKDSSEGSGDFMTLKDIKPNSDNVLGNLIGAAEQSLGLAGSTLSDEYGTLEAEQIESSKNGMPFYFKDLRDNGYVIFRAFLTGISDNVTPNWTTENYIGRSEPIYKYSNAEREVSFTLTLFAHTAEELDMIYKKMNRLTSMCYPEYLKDPLINSGGSGESKLRMKPPIARLRLGEYLGNGITDGMVGFIQSLSYSVPDNSPWETKQGKRVPKNIEATITFKVIKGEVPALNKTPSTGGGLFGKVKSMVGGPEPQEFYGFNSDVETS